MNIVWLSLLCNFEICPFFFTQSSLHHCGIIFYFYFIPSEQSITGSVDNENALYTQYRKCSKDFVLSIDVHYSYYIHVCALLSCLELHPSYSNTHAHDVGAHAYYSNSGVTRAVSRK